VSALTDGFFNEIRTRAPHVLDEVISFELFNVIDELTRHYLQTTPPTRGTAVDTWLSSDQYSEYYVLLIDGTLSRVLSQLDKPYTNPPLAAYYETRYQQALMRARDDFYAESSPSIYTRLVDTLRVRLPNVKDPVLELEIFNVIDEFCREGFIYTDTVEITLVAGTAVYDLTQAGKTIINISNWSHATLDLTDAVFDDDTEIVSLSTVPDLVDATTPLFVEMDFVPLNSVATADLLPEKYWTQYYQGILDGVLGRMMSHLGKPYSNERMATYHGRRFRKAINQARVDNGQRFRGDQPWVFPQDFR
jgi:hypothetical protein